MRWVYRDMRRARAFGAGTPVPGERQPHSVLAMGLFSGSNRTPRGLRDCPVCDESVPKAELKMNGVHLRTHVHAIQSGEGAGGYTFRCRCGPADMYWDDEFKALAGLAVHLMERHHHDVF